MPFPLQPLPVNPAKPWVVGMQSGIDHLVHGFLEAVLVKPHAPGQGAKHFDVRAAFAERLDGSVRHLQIVVPIGSLQVFVLEERGRAEERRRHNRPYQ